MIFKSDPNLYVRISNKFIQRATGKKGLHFDENGLYITDNEWLIKVLSQNFETVEMTMLEPVKEEPLPFEDIEEVIEDHEEDRIDNEEIEEIPAQKVEVKKPINKKRR